MMRPSIRQTVLLLLACPALIGGQCLPGITGFVLGRTSMVGSWHVAVVDDAEGAAYEIVVDDLHQVTQLVDPAWGDAPFILDGRTHRLPDGTEYTAEGHLEVDGSVLTLQVTRRLGRPGGAALTAVADAWEVTLQLEGILALDGAAGILTEQFHRPGAEADPADVLRAEFVMTRP